mmetsp:Transcript_4719/g.14994  ORF Transcript_4719/g.14994 Transcript_4719/m.14994 type:complete len:289 (-) Transcript_4719:43-909(-)
MAVRTTVMDSLSGSMKSRAFAMEMKTSSLIRSGMPYLRMNCSTESSSCLSIKSWPSMSMGSSGGAVWIFSGSVSIFWFNRIARAKLKGAGMPATKSKVVNSPGSSCIAKTILCTFHCKRSWMPSSENRRSMFGYAPKKMCSPVSIQSPSLSCQAETLPPSTSRASYTTGSWPASTRYLAQARPLRPPPMMATFFFVGGVALSSPVKRSESLVASRYGCVFSTFGFGKSTMCRADLDAGARRSCFGADFVATSASAADKTAARQRSLAIFNQGRGWGMTRGWAEMRTRG